MRRWGLINLIIARYQIQLALSFRFRTTYIDFSLVALELLTPSCFSPTARRIVTSNSSAKRTT